VEAALHAPSLWLTAVAAVGSGELRELPRRYPRPAAASRTRPSC